MRLAGHQIYMHNTGTRITASSSTAECRMTALAWRLTAGEAATPSWTLTPPSQRSVAGGWGWGGGHKKHTDVFISAKTMIKKVIK